MNNLASNAEGALLIVYNVIWATDVLSLSWKISAIILIVKPGNYPKLMTSYRPIVLTNFWKIDQPSTSISSRSHGIFFPCQYGFQKKLLPLDPLLKLTTNFQNGFLQNKHTKAYIFALILPEEKGFYGKWTLLVLKENF